MWKSSKTRRVLSESDRGHGGCAALDPPSILHLGARSISPSALKEILSAKAKAGVEVRLLYDPIGSQAHLSRAYVRDMQAAGSPNGADFSSLPAAYDQLPQPPQNHRDRRRDRLYRRHEHRHRSTSTAGRASTSGATPRCALSEKAPRSCRRCSWSIGTTPSGKTSSSAAYFPAVATARERRRAGPDPDVGTRLAMGGDPAALLLHDRLGAAACVSSSRPSSSPTRPLPKP